MTRKILIKQTHEYIQVYIGALLFQALVTFLVFELAYAPRPNMPVSDSFIQASYLVPLGFIFLINYIFYYRYLYDIYKKNICGAVIIRLDFRSYRGRVNMLSRVFEGTVIGKSKKKDFLKPRRNTDYVFKVRGNVLSEFYDCWEDKMFVKYLKYSKAIVEVESIVKDAYYLLTYSKENKDYVLYRYPSIPIEEAKQVLKMGKITRVNFTLKEIAEKTVGGIIYGILMSSVIYIIEYMTILRY